MKTFKSLLFIIISAFCFNSFCYSQDKGKTLVGILENGKPVLTIDKEKVIKIYCQNLLKLSNVEARFTDIILVNSDENKFLLVFKGDNIKSTFLVSEIDSKLFASNGISCTTSECSSEEIGCSPMPSELGCWPCKNSGKCTKVVSSGSLLDY